MVKLNNVKGLVSPSTTKDKTNTETNTPDKPVAETEAAASTKERSSIEAISECYRQECLRVEIATITQSPEYQVRLKTDQVTVNRYAEVIKAGTVMPPVKLARVKARSQGDLKVGNATPMLVLFDGFHRVAAHVKLGLAFVEATVEDMDPELARWKAAEANMSHGLSLGNKEIREAFRRFIKAKQHVLGRDGRGKQRLMSYRDMSKHIHGKQHTTIRNWMKQDFPNVYAQIGDKVEDVDWSTKGKAVAEVIEEQDKANNPVAMLEAAFKAYQATTDAQVRGQAVYLAEQIVEQMKKAGGWEDMTPEF
jgi:hypothetical protein